MATNYPGGLDNFTNPTGTDPMNTPSVLHSAQHTNLNDAMEAVQATLGVDPQGAAATVEARLTGTPVTEFIYDPLGTPDNVSRFDDFGDLGAAVAATAFPASIYFPYNVTIPAGTYNMGSMKTLTLNGNGSPAAAGPLAGGRFVTFADGAELTGISRLDLPGGIGIITQSSSPVIEQNQLLINMEDGAVLGAEGTAEFYHATSTTSQQSQTVLGIGCSLADLGYEVLNFDAGAFGVLVTLGANAGWENDVVRGSGLLVRFIVDPSSNPATLTATFANFTGVDIPTLPALSALVAYDPTSSGMTATNVQDAIDELRSLIP